MWGGGQSQLAWNMRVCDIQHLYACRVWRLWLYVWSQLAPCQRLCDQFFSFSIIGICVCMCSVVSFFHFPVFYHFSWFPCCLLCYDIMVRIAVVQSTAPGTRVVASVKNWADLTFSASQFISRYGEYLDLRRLALMNLECDRLSLYDLSNAYDRDTFVSAWDMFWTYCSGCRISC